MRCRRPPEFFEALERRELLNGLAKLPLFRNENRPGFHNAYSTLRLATHKNGAHPNSSAPPGDAFTPADMRNAYGLNQVMFGNIAGDGRGQTIALIVAYDYPTAL